MKCARRGCERLAVEAHPLFGVWVCARHWKGRRRGYYVSQPVFAGVQNDTARGPMQVVSSIAIGRASKRSSPAWRTYEAPGPVTVRKWDVAE